MVSQFKQTKRLGTLLLVLVIALAIPVQSVGATIFAASTTTSSSASSSSDTSGTSSTSTTTTDDIDSWMPDQALQQAVYTVLHNSDDATNDHGGHDITSVSEITPAMLADIRNLNAPTAKITDLTGLQYATGITQFDLSAATIEKAPGDWSIFEKAKYSKLGTIDASSSDIDLKDLTKLPSGDVTYTLKNADDLSLPNVEQHSVTGSAVTQLTVGKTITYDADLSSMKAYIPLSDWYKGFLNSDGSYSYGTTSAYPTLPTGVTLDLTNHRFVVDLNDWGNKELKIPNFDIKDDLSNTAFTSGRAEYYSTDNSLDAVVPMSGTLSQASQTVKPASRTDPTGSIDTSSFGFGSATDAQITINSGDLTASDISFTSDLADNKINYTLSASGLQKLIAGDLTSDLTIAAGGKLIKLTLTLAESLDTWMPDKTLQTQLQTALTTAGLGTLTKTNLAKLSTLPTLTGITNLTGLEYIANLSKLSITSSQLNELKATNSQVLAKLTGLKSLEIDDSGLGGSLADWGISSLTKLTELKATGDALTDPAPTEYATDTNLTGLNLANNAITGAVSQFPLSSWPQLSLLQLNNNQLTGTLPDLTGNSAMGYVDLSHNQLTGSIPGSYGELTQLTGLQLGNNQLSGTLPDALGNATALTDLALNDNSLTGTIPTDWSQLTKLKTLDLADNAFSGELTQMAQFANLTQVNLNSNQFTGTLPADWFTTKLTHFEANNNQFSGKLPDSLSSAINLTWLDISNNQLTGDLPDLSQAVDLKTMAYGANHITSGRTVASAGGNYQTWNITNPDWQTSSDGKTLTLDLSKYYGGEQGQSGYQYLGIYMVSGEKGVTLDKTDSAHPQLTIDTTTTTVGTSFSFDLFDQAGQQAELGGDGTTKMNYMATVTVKMPKTYQINTNNVDFGSHPVGTGAVNATDFNLLVDSTGAAGDSYQLTAQTTGLTSNGHEVPLDYYNGQHEVLLTAAAQSIYDYQPDSDEDSTTVGDSSDSSKGNLRTDIANTAYAGDYSGEITYTLASAPADNPDTAAKSSDLTAISATTLSQLNPTLAVDGLSAGQAAVRTKLATNLTNFVQNELADSDGVLYSSYGAGHNTDGNREELTESSGMWLLALAMSGDETSFDKAFTGITSRFYDSATQTFNWQSLGDSHTITQGSASVDDLRIIQALLIMNQKQPDNSRTAWLNKLIDGFTKYDLNDYYQMIDGYSQANGQEKKIRLDYLDLATLKAVYEAKGLGAAGDTAYNDQLKLIKDSYISDQLPLFATYFNYATGAYQVGGDTSDGQVNVTDGLLTMLNLAKVGELPQTSLDWLKAHTADRTLYNDYDISTGEPVSKVDAPSNYAYVAQIAAAVGDADLYSQALTVLKSLTSDEDNPDNPLAATDPLYGSTQYAGESYAFNDLNMLLAYNMVFSTT